jgi:phospholipase C
MQKRGTSIPVSGFALSTAGLCLLATTALTSVARADSTATTTPIQHLVVIFQENVSFDHYFGTYPTALNSPGEPQFKASPIHPQSAGLALLLTVSRTGSC